MIAQKRKVAAEDFKGKKYIKRSDLEAARLAKLREEEEAERKSQVSTSDPKHSLICCSTVFGSITFYLSMLSCSSCWVKATLAYIVRCDHYMDIPRLPSRPTCRIIIHVFYSFLVVWRHYH